MTELFPYLRRGYLGALVWIGLPQPQDGQQIPTFPCKSYAVTWAVNMGLLPRDTKYSSIEVREK